MGHAASRASLRAWTAAASAPSGNATTMMTVGTAVMNSRESAVRCIAAYMLSACTEDFKSFQNRGCFYVNAVYWFRRCASAFIHGVYETAIICTLQSAHFKRNSPKLTIKIDICAQLSVMLTIKSLSLSLSVAVWPSLYAGEWIFLSCTGAQSFTNIFLLAFFLLAQSAQISCSRIQESFRFWCVFLLTSIHV